MSERLPVIFWVEFWRYFLVSAVALAVDMGFLLFLANFVHYTLAAATSFLLGAGVHYLLSVTFVFRRRKLISRRFAELGVFLGAGAGALLVNVAVIAVCVEFFDSSLLVAKFVAAGFSFLFGYVVRKWALF